VIKDALTSFMSLAEVESTLGCKVAGTILPSAELYSTSIKKGTPIVLLDPDSIAASSVTNLMDKLAEPTLVAVSGGRSLQEVNAALLT
jgi:MinD-like ATPase involved in chromosome partitioning or flagellar assembly